MFFKLATMQPENAAGVNDGLGKEVSEVNRCELSSSRFTNQTLLRQESYKLVVVLLIFLFMLVC